MLSPTVWQFFCVFSFLFIHSAAGTNKQIYRLVIAHNLQSLLESTSCLTRSLHLEPAICLPQVLHWYLPKPHLSIFTGTWPRYLHWNLLRQAEPDLNIWTRTFYANIFCTGTFCTLRNLTRNLVLKLHRIAPQLFWAKDPSPQSVAVGDKNIVILYDTNIIQIWLHQSYILPFFTSPVLVLMFKEILQAFSAQLGDGLGGHVHGTVAVGRVEHATASLRQQPWDQSFFNFVFQFWLMKIIYDFFKKM